MELTETIDNINHQLADLYGIDTITGQPIWRIVWSEDQFEHRLGTYDDYTPGGIYLRTVTEVRYVPKYSQWIQEKYVLERMVVVPETSRADLPATKVSYEPLFPFEGNAGQYLPPKLSVAQFVIDNVLAAQGIGSLAKYKDPMSDLSTQDQIEAKAKEIDTLQKELFGNETRTGDSIAHGEAIIVPSNYKKVN